MDDTALRFSNEDINKCRDWLRENGCSLHQIHGWMKGERTAGLSFWRGEWHAFISIS